MSARILLTGAALAAALLVVPAEAQQSQRVRGTIENVNGQVLDVKTRDGTAVKVKLADNAPVRAVVKASLADVKSGTYVGATGMPQPDGTQKAVEIHIFPETLRGTGDGHRPWDLSPNSTMTNGAVDSEVAASDGQKLVLKYKDGEKTLVVTPDTAIVAYAPGTAADLKPGEKIFVAAASKDADGMLTAPNITVSKNGINPPM
jgi:hypothetical protein